MVIMNHLLENVSSYDGNVLLAAILSLLLVILLVLLLHVYAKWFLAQAPRRRSSPMSVSQVFLPATRFHHFHSFTTTSDPNNTASADQNSKGLEASLIASIPLFVFRTSSSRDDHDDDEYNMDMQGEVGGFGSECVICLSGFEECDVGRCLPKCGHAFHVECIDMWLHSHSNCPICRAPVVGENSNNNEMVNSSIEEAAPGPAVELLSVIAAEGERRLTESSAATDHRRHQVNNGRR